MSKGRIVAFDYGRRRIGVAVSDADCFLASARAFIFNDMQALNAIKKLIELNSPVKEILVGDPIESRGLDPIRPEILEFAEILEENLQLKVTLVDERHTSKTATSSFKEAGLKGAKIRQLKDSEAARIILQEHLDGQVTSTR